MLSEIMLIYGLRKRLRSDFVPCIGSPPLVTYGFEENVSDLPAYDGFQVMAQQRFDMTPYMCAKR